MVNEKIANQKSKLSYVVQVIFFFIASIFIGTGIYEVIPLSYVLQRSLHVGQEKVVLISSSFSLGYAVGFLIFGWLANYVETKKLLIIGLIFLMISTFTVGFATTYANMIALRVIQGSCAGCFAPLVFSLIVIMFPENYRISGITAVTTGFVMAGVLGQLYASTITNIYSWTAVFRIQALVYIVVIVFMMKLAPKTDGISPKIDKSNFILQLLRLLLNKSLLPCYIITVTLLFSFVGMYTVMGMLFQKVFAFNSGEIIWIKGIGIIGMISSMLFTKLAKKFGAVSILSIGLILAAVGVLIIGISNNVILSIVMSVVFVFGIKVSLPMIVSLIGTYAGKESGNAMTLYTCILFIGATMGPIVATNIMNGTGSYSLSFVFLAIVLGISFIISVIIGRSRNVNCN